MFRSVQSAVTSVSFPETLEDLRRMGTKWLGIIGKDWITDIDVLLHFPCNKDITWIAPKWLTAGDLLFFYHTKSARRLMRNALAEAEQMRQQSYTIITPYTNEEINMLIEILERVDKISKGWSGKIFAVGEVSGKPVRAFDENKHFKGTIYAPMASAIVFESPISSDEFKHFLKIGQNTTTPIYGNQLRQLKELLSKHNKLPAILASAVPGDLSFHNVNKNNWMDISCRKDARFINEAQLRSYLLDYLLRKIKDSRSIIHAECNCYRRNERTGIADYFVRFNNRWIPVEAKLNVLAEQNLRFQLAKYIHLDSFSPTLGPSTSERHYVDNESCCLVFDQSGMYVTREGEFIGCSGDKPLIKRDDIKELGTAQLREQILRSIV